jgi:23S rRNA (cytosine1962-C5)-methyltransferase
VARFHLHPGKERSVLRRHPWIFAGSLARLEGRARPGDTVEVVDAGGRVLGRAAYSPASQIRARMWTFDENTPVDHAFFKRRVAESVAWRATHPDLKAQDGLRLIHGEADGLPGIIADRYGPVVVLQLTSAGAEKWREAIVAALIQTTGCAAVHERSDSEVRRLEGLERHRSPSSKTACAWKSMSSAATRPASISTSATIACSPRGWRRDGGC